MSENLIFINMLQKSLCFQIKLQQWGIFLRFYKYLFNCLFCISAWPAAAQDNNLFQLSLVELLEIPILSTPKFSTSADRIPSTVSVITAGEIQLYGWQSLAEILSSVQSFNVTADYTYDYVTVRGFAGAGDYRSRIQVLINGLRVNENIYGSVGLGSDSLVDVNLIERIEIIKGSSASVYGGNSMFATLNIVTRKGKSFDGIEYRSLYSKKNSVKNSLSWGKQFNENTQWMSSVTVFDGNGQAALFPELQAQGEEFSVDNAGAEKGYKFASQFNSGNLHGQLLLSNREKIVPTGSYGSIFNDPAHTEKDRYLLGELNHSLEFSKKLQLNNRIYFGRYDFTGYYPYDYEPDYVVNHDEVLGKWWGVESRINYSFSPANNVTAGVEFRHNTQQDQFNEDVGYGCYDAETTSPCLDSHYASEEYALYLQQELLIHEALSMTFGLRFDNAQEHASQTSPRFGFVYKWSESNNLKFLFSKAFRNANPYERFYDLPYYEYANKDLAPEKMESYDISWEWKDSKGTSLTANVYTFLFENLVGSDEDFNFINLPDYRTNGVELELNKRWSSGIALKAAYTFQHAEFYTETTVENVPSNIVKMNLDLPTPVQGLRIGAELQAVTERETFLGTVSGHQKVNLNLLYQSSSLPLSLKASVRNLFDTNYAEPIASDPFMWIERDRINQPGRVWQVELSVNY